MGPIKKRLTDRSNDDCAEGKLVSDKKPKLLITDGLFGDGQIDWLYCRPKPTAHVIKNPSRLQAIGDYSSYQQTPMILSYRRIK